MSSGRQTMDFFGSQAQAMRRTGLLIFLFCTAVLLIILGVYFVTVFALLFVAGLEKESVWDVIFWPELFLVTMGLTLAIVAGGTIVKVLELRQGGCAVAKMLGGVPVSPDTRDPDERKLLNVVEEMSLASGCPMPSVYILPNERRINAFAAGYTQADAAVATTLGAIRHLSRDELQGVMAHEFSHIINGDMRLNIKLIGTLNGILQIALLGTVLLRGGSHVAMAGRSSRRNESGGAAVAMIVIGLLLFALGSIGIFFARAIKAAVSRQREFLADASAVQFTRNPHGIAGALKKIGGHAGYSKISNAHAEEASHMFFGNAVASHLALLSTHPPLDERIRAVDPTWDGTFPKIEPLKPEDKPKVLTPEEPRLRTQPPGTQQLPFPFPVLALPAGAAMGNPTAQEVVSRIGTITPAALEYAGAMLDSMPDSLRQRTRQPLPARNLVYALVIEKEEEPRRKEMAYLKEHVDAATMEDVEVCLQEMADLDERYRLPLLELSLQGLRNLSRKEREDFLKALSGLIEASGEVVPFEFAVQHIVQAAVSEAPKRGAQYYSISPLLPHISAVLSAAVYAGADDEKGAVEAFRQGAQRFGTNSQSLVLLARPNCTIGRVSAALDALSGATPHIKRAALEACASAILYDKTVRTSEAELLRAISAALDCPMPPIFELPKQT